jgi:hypothetical protein
VAMYLTEPLEPRSMTLVHALGNFAVVTLHVTSPVFRFNSGLFSVNLDGRACDRCASHACPRSFETASMTGT